MRFRQNHSAGDPGWMTGSIGKLVKEAANDGEAILRAGRNAKRFEISGVDQKLLRTATALQIGDEVQSVHTLVIDRPSQR